MDTPWSLDSGALGSDRDSDSIDFNHLSDAEFEPNSPYNDADNDSDGSSVRVHDSEVSSPFLAYTHSLFRRFHARTPPLLRRAINYEETPLSRLRNIGSFSDPYAQDLRRAVLNSLRTDASDMPAPADQLPMSDQLLSHHVNPSDLEARLVTAEDRIMSSEVGDNVPPLYENPRIALLTQLGIEENPHHSHNRRWGTRNSLVPQRAPTATGPSPAATAPKQNQLVGIGSLVTQLRILQQRRAAERATASAVASSADATVANSGNVAEDCIICCEVLTAPESSATKCGHIFHTHCALACVRKGNSFECPICRSPVHQAELVQLHNGLPPKSDERNGASRAGAHRGAGNRCTGVGGCYLGSSSRTAGRISAFEKKPDPGSEIDKSIANVLHLVAKELTECVDKFTTKTAKLDTLVEQRTAEVTRRAQASLKAYNEQLAEMLTERRKNDKIKKEITILRDSIKKQEIEMKRSVTAKNRQERQLEIQSQELAAAKESVAKMQRQVAEELTNVRRKEEIVSNLMKAVKKKRKREHADDTEGDDCTDRSGPRNPEDEQGKAKVVRNSLSDISRLDPLFSSDLLTRPRSSESLSRIPQPPRKLSSPAAKEKVTKKPLNTDGLVQSSTDVGTKARPAEHPHLSSQPLGLSSAPYFRAHSGPANFSNLLASSPQRPRPATVMGRPRGTFQALSTSRSSSLSAFVGQRQKVQQPKGPIGKVTGIRKPK